MKGGPNGPPFRCTPDTGKDRPPPADYSPAAQDAPARGFEARQG